MGASTTGAAVPTCSVCFEVLGRYGGPTSLPCGHNGCLQCLSHVQRTKPACPICRTEFSPSAPLAVNYELRDLCQLAAALTTVERDEGWQAVTAGARRGGGQGGAGEEDGDEERSTVAQLVPSAPPLHVDLRSVLEGQADLMSLEPPKWAPDSSSPDCCGCRRPFSFLIRSRHHCRVCGELFCDACCSERLLLPPKFLQPEPQRTCAPCAELLRPLQPLLAGTVAAAVQAPVHDATDWSVWRSLLNSPLSRRLEEDLFKATNTLRSFARLGGIKPERGIPQAVLRSCAGLAILSVIKVGAGWSCGVGTGLVVARRRDGSWSPPSAVLSLSAGAGWQLGCELTDVVVVLRNAAAVRAFAGSQLGLGGSVSIAAGPLGREAAAKLALGAAGSTAVCYSYSVSRGAYAGLALEGTLLRSRDAVNQAFYGRRCCARALLLSETATPPAAAAALYDALDLLLARAGEASSAQFSVRALPWGAEEEAQNYEEEEPGSPVGLGSPSYRVHEALPSPPQRRGRGREREREGGGGAPYGEVAGGRQLWHAPSAPAFAAAATWGDDDQPLPLLFD